jgi:hypothetical protein
MVGSITVPHHRVKFFAKKPISNHTLPRLAGEKFQPVKGAIERRARISIVPFSEEKGAQ